MIDSIIIVGAFLFFIVVLLLFCITLVKKRSPTLKRLFVRPFGTKGPMLSAEWEEQLNELVDTIKSDSQKTSEQENLELNLQTKLLIATFAALSCEKYAKILNQEIIDYLLDTFNAAFQKISSIDPKSPLIAEFCKDGHFSFLKRKKQ